MKSDELLIEDVLKKMMPSDENDSLPEFKKKTSYTRKNEYSINLKAYLEGILGVDVTAVDGLKEISVPEIMSVTGTDMNKWSTPEHFTSWLNLSPRPTEQRRPSNINFWTFKIPLRNGFTHLDTFNLSNQTEQRLNTKITKDDLLFFPVTTTRTGK
jgi:hypothetical protein